MIIWRVLWHIVFYSNPLRGNKMKQLTLYTNRHREELQKFAKQASEIAHINWAKWRENKNKSPDEKKRLFALNISWDRAESDKLAELLMVFLEEVALSANPIYCNSPKLMEMARNLRNTELYRREKKHLKIFLKYNRVLHLEGYATFRMEEYRNKLDMITYGLIKKLNLYSLESLE